MAIRRHLPVSATYSHVWRFEHIVSSVWDSYPLAVTFSWLGLFSFVL